jgi:hypothetical protein
VYFRPIADLHKGRKAPQRETDERMRGGQAQLPGVSAVLAVK